MSANPKEIVIPAGYSKREDPQPVVAWQGSPLSILNTAVQRGMDPATLKDLMDLNDRWQKSEAERSFNEAFAAFKAEAVKVTKNRDVTAGPLAGKKYAELIAWVEAVTPALSQHGLAASWRITKDEKDWLEVTCSLKHVKGHSESVSMGGPPDVGGAKSAIQARASTVSYLERYTLKAITGLAESGDDNDGTPGACMTDADLKAWGDKIEATTNEKAAKEVCAQAIAAADALNDLGAYKALKEALKAHLDFMKEAGK